MLFEVLSTGSMFGIIGATHYFSNNTNNDGNKIVKISENCGLIKKDERMRCYRKNRIKDKSGKVVGAEYVFKIPLGLEFDDFTKNYGKFKDGLNNRSTKMIILGKLKELKFDKTIVKQLKKFANNRVLLSKEIEMDYDGMLKVKVYDQGLQKQYDLTEETIKSVKAWQVPIGATFSSQIVHDFEASPHVLIGGATDTGKSNILNVIITTLLARNLTDVEFSLIDLKGGLEFSTYENLLQTKNFASEVEEAVKALTSAQNQMISIFEKLRTMRKKNVQEAGIKTRHFVIIDESAELSSAGETDPTTKKLKIQCEGIIKDIARRGRACGFRLVYATQYPTTETVPSQVKRNLMTRICLPVDTSIASNVVLDEGGAEKLPLLKGRAIYKHNRCQTMQSYYISDKLINDVIKPHIIDINVKGRKECARKETVATPTRRTYITEFEEA